MKLFTEGLSNGLNKKEAMEYADTSPEFVDKHFNLEQEEYLTQRWKRLGQTQNTEYLKSYKNIYFTPKTKEFLEKLNGNSIKSALEESDFDEDDFNIWYGSGKKEFLKYNR
jgi:hypothetical protein